VKENYKPGMLISPSPHNVGTPDKLIKKALPTDGLKLDQARVKSRAVSIGKNDKKSLSKQNSQRKTPTTRKVATEYVIVNQKRGATSTKSKKTKSAQRNFN
jgi:hypothetical protein